MLRPQRRFVDVGGKQLVGFDAGLLQELDPARRP